MTLSLPSKITLVLIGVFALCLLIRYLFNKHTQKFFQSKEFAELNRATDVIPETYEKIMKLSHKLKQSVYVNFSPSAIDEMKMQNNEGDFNRETDLPAHTYLCSQDVIEKYAKNPYGLLKQYCGFSNNPAVMKYLRDMYELSSQLSDIVDTFTQQYEEELDALKDKMPTFIYAFKKKTVLLMLGMDLPNNWAEDLLPSYTFRQVDNRQVEIKIIFDAESLPQIIQYFA